MQPFACLHQYLQHIAQVNIYILMQYLLFPLGML